jgi:hypothetical protein
VGRLKEQQKEFLDENPYVGVVTTLRDDGSPHSTIVWVDVEDGKPSFNTATGRAKPKHLEHDPRASLLVVDPSDSHKLAKKYIGRDQYPWRKPTERRVKVLIEPERVDASGFDD